jgi:transposase
VYGALHEQGLSNRQIAAKLDVNESSVRRGLKAYKPLPIGRRFLVTVVEVD